MKYLAFIILLAAVLATGETAQQEMGIIYSPIGKRDPFKLPQPDSSSTRAPASTEALERYGIEQLQLKGILRDGTTPKALFEDPEGHTHIISEGEVVGREKATVSRVLQTEVILTEKTYNYLGVENLYEKVLSLPQK